MAEAVRRMVALAFADPAVQRVGAFCDIDNTASIRVLEKAGMSREGRRKSWLVLPAFGETPRDAYSYAIKREEWRGGQSGAD